MLRVVLHARARINACSKIAAIPPELLSSIFLHASLEDEAVEIGDSRPRFESRSRVRISHVCRAWRNLALATPSLWAQIDNHHTTPYEEYVVRSQGAPATLRLDGLFKGTQKSFIEKLAPRLRRLDIVDIKQNHMDALQEFEMPVLECLTAYPADARPKEWDGSLSQSQRTNLRALSLRGLTRLPANQFPMLTHLDLECWGQVTLLDLLTNTPALQHLRFKFSAHALLHQESAHGPVLLRALRSLVMAYAELTSALKFLTHLSMPKKPLIRIYSIVESAALLPPSHFKDFMSDQGDIISLHLCGVESLRGLTIVGHSHDKDSGLWLYVSGSKVVGRWPRLVHTMLPLYALEFLSIATSDADTVPHILPNLPCLVELQVTIFFATSAEQVSSALGTALGQTTPILCSRLHTFVLYIRSERQPAAFSPLVLIDVAAMRAQMECRLRRVVIQWAWTRNPIAEYTAIQQQFTDAFESLPQHVDELVLVGAGQPGWLETGKVQPQWALQDAEKYWTLNSAQRAEPKLW